MAIAESVRLLKNSFLYLLTKVAHTVFLNPPYAITSC